MVSLLIGLPCQHQANGTGAEEMGKVDACSLARILLPTLFIIHCTHTPWYGTHHSSFPSLLPSRCSSVSSPAPSLTEMTSPPTSLGKLRTSDENSHKFPPKLLQFSLDHHPNFLPPRPSWKQCSLPHGQVNPFTCFPSHCCLPMLVGAWVFSLPWLLVQLLHRGSNLLIQK